MVQWELDLFGYGTKRQVCVMGRKINAGYMQKNYNCLYVYIYSLKEHCFSIKETFKKVCATILGIQDSFSPNFITLKFYHYTVCSYYPPRVCLIINHSRIQITLIIKITCACSMAYLQTQKANKSYQQRNTWITSCARHKIANYKTGIQCTRWKTGLFRLTGRAVEKRDSRFYSGNPGSLLRHCQGTEGHNGMLKRQWDTLFH